MALEESVIEAVLDWGKSSEERKHDVGKLIAESRLCQLSFDHLFKLKSIFSTNTDNATARMSIDNAIEYKLIPTKRQATSSIIAKYRFCSPVEEVLALIAHDNLFAFSFLQTKWFILAKLPCDPGGGLATCSTGTSLFVTGGCNSYETCIEYKASQNKWKERPPLLRGRYCHVMIATSDSLFVFGGYEDTVEETFVPLSSVEKYTFAAKKWENCGELNYPAADITAVVVDNRIYMFGGWLELERQRDGTGKNVLPMLQIYDISTDVCTCIPLSSFPVVHKAIQCNDLTYLFCSHGEVFKFEIPTETYELIQENDIFSKPDFDIVQRDGVIHAAFDSKRVTLNLETGNTCVEPFKPFMLDYFSLEKVSIDKKFLDEERK